MQRHTRTAALLRLMFAELWPFNGHLHPPASDVLRDTMTRKHWAGFFTSMHQRSPMRFSVFSVRIYNQKQASCKQTGSCWSLWWMREVICGVFKSINPGICLVQCESFCFCFFSFFLFRSSTDPGLLRLTAAPRKVTSTSYINPLTLTLMLLQDCKF